jgi:hypothetical protein
MLFLQACPICKIFSDPCESDIHERFWSDGALTRDPFYKSFSGECFSFNIAVDELNKASFKDVTCMRVFEVVGR